eukprot:scaffold3561_cov450-Prasinococcus_capsulatus_cf.AAC.1
MAPSAALRARVQKILGPDKEIQVLIEANKVKEKKYKPAKEKPRVLCLNFAPGKKKKDVRILLNAFRNEGDTLSLSQTFKLKHLLRIDFQSDILTLQFETSRVGKESSRWVADARSRGALLSTIIRLCKEHYKRTPVLKGFDEGDVFIWQREVPAQGSLPGEESVESELLGDETLGEPTPTPAVSTTAEPESLLSEEEVPAHASLPVPLLPSVVMGMCSVSQEKDIEFLLERYELDIGDSRGFQVRLKKELAALEAANVHEILGSVPEVNQLAVRIGHSLNELEDMEAWLGTLNSLLKHMREDISTIENRNNRLEIQTHNNTLLLEEVSDLLGRLTVPRELEERLRGGSFRTTKDMQRALDAAAKLSEMLAAVAPEAFEEREQAEMRAVKEHKEDLADLRDTFVERSVAFLKSAQEKLLDKKHYLKEKPKRGLRLPDHGSLRRQLHELIPLFDAVFQLDRSVLAPLAITYAKFSNKLLRREIESCASQLEKAVLAPGHPEAGFEEIFKTLLKSLIPLVMEDCAFMLALFHLDSSIAESEDELDRETDVQQERTREDCIHIAFHDLERPLMESLDSITSTENLLAIPLIGVTMSIREYLKSEDQTKQVETKGGLEVVLRILNACQELLEKRLAAYIKERISTLSKFTESRSDKSKKELAIPLMQHLPGVIDSIERLAGTKYSHVTQSVYQDLTEGISAAIEAAASAALKYPELVRVENYAGVLHALQGYVKRSAILETTYTEVLLLGTGTRRSKGPQIPLWTCRRGKSTQGQPK